MTYNYRTKGVCSKEMHIELNDDHTIKSVEVIGGCNGNLQGISRLVEGMKARGALARMRGHLRASKNTSCPRSARHRAGRGAGAGQAVSRHFLPARCHRHGQKNAIKSCKMPFPSLDKRR